MAEGDFRAAVHALYSSSGEARRAANQWLIEFARTPAAWAAAHTLVGEEREDMAYFGANMLYLKVRSEWHLLSDEARRAEYDRMWRTCTEGGSASASGPPGQVAKRLCLAVAAAAARTSGLAGQTAQLALSMLGAEGDGRAGVTLELLAALPLAVCEEEEATDGGSTGRAELLPLVPQLLAALEARATRSAEACLGCMRALQGWLALKAGVSLLALCSRHGPLLAAALHGLTAPDARPLNAAAADALTDLFSATNSPLSSAAPAEARGAVESLAAQFELMASQLGLSALASTRAEADDRVLGFCRVLAAFAERAVDVVAVTHGPLLCLVELMLLCAGAELRLAELTVDFWAGLQDTPVVERHESLRAPLYRRLAQVWLGQCTLPSSFVSWDEEPSVEEEDFSRFREQAALEVLESCLGLLGAEMATMLRTALDSSRSSWQTLEVTLFAMRGLHVPIKTAVRDGAGPRAESSVALQHLLSFVFAQLSTWHPPGHPSPLVESACRLIGAYGKWLAGEESLLRGCLRVVLESLESTAAAPHAAEAFRALCIHGRGVLARPAVLTELVGACAPLLASETLEPELCLTMQEGLARLVGASESPSDATPLLHALIRIPCQRLDQLLNQGRPPPTAAAAPPPVVDAPMAAAVALQLRMLAAAIRYCDSFPTLSGTQHPVLGVLQLCWPLLQETAVRGTPEVLLSLYDVYGRAMTCLRMQLAPLLPQLLAQLGSTFSRTPVVGCLACVTEALELYGEEPEEEEALSDTLGRLVEVMCSVMNASPEAEPELLTAFFGMCHRCLVFRPGILLALPCVPQLFRAACGCVCHQEFTHTRAAITFLCLFLTGTAAAAAHREGAAHCLQASGSELMRQCIRGLAGLSPDNLIEHQIELLRVLGDSAPTAVSGWLAAALADPSLDLGAMPRNGSALAAFSRAIGQQPTSISAFQAVAADFSRMCRGKIRPS